MGACRTKTTLKLYFRRQHTVVRISSDPSGDSRKGERLGKYKEVCRAARVIAVNSVVARAAGAAEQDENLATAVEAARALERWGSTRGWRGPDPYDALNARRLPHIARRSPLALRVITQAVKRSPLNLRPLLGIPEGLSPATLAHVISAYARNGFLDERVADTKLRESIAALAALRCTAFPESCWGYHFDVQTRVFFYPRTSPNTIATAFAGLGAPRRVRTRWRRRRARTGHRRRGVLRPPRAPDHDGAGRLLRLPARRHHADPQREHARGCAPCAPRARDRRDGLCRRSPRAVEYTVSRQRADGSWPYGEQPHLIWVDGFHTGYVLDCLLMSLDADLIGTRAEEAWRRGFRYYTDVFIAPDGAPRYKLHSQYPIDGQSLAQALHTLSLAAPFEPEKANRRWAVLRFALHRMRRADGAFLFQRERCQVNPIPHPRWVQSPMLSALSRLIRQGP